MRIKRNKKGQSVIEFLLVSPVLIYSLFLLLIIWDICNDIVVANHAAYYYARTMVVQLSKGETSDDAETAAKNAAAAIMPSDWLSKGGTANCIGYKLGYNRAVPNTWDITVDIGYNYSLPGILEFFGADYKIHGYCMMRKLQY